MINISEEVRTLYKTDRYPMHTEPIAKNLFIEVKESGTIITEENLESETFAIKESICSASEIVFGACEASMVSFTVYNITEDLSSKTLRIWQNINGHDVPFGTYKVETVTKRDGDARWKEITAYDRMPELDKDATAWFTQFWNTHTKSTIKEFRLSFFAFMDFDIVDQELANDYMEITKTIDPEFIKGRYIAQKIGEINACFGHFTRENKFKYISIGAIGLYPSETLYPAEDLYPSDPTEMMFGDSAVYFSDESSYEDYYVRAIDSVQIKASDGGEGVTVGEENKNPYIVHSNFFTFDKTDAQLREIAENFLYLVKNKFYIPNTTKMIGLPYLEVGDTVSIMLEQEAIESFIFERNLTGIQSLEDEIIARGNEYRKNDIDENTELMQLKSKVENVVADTNEKIGDLEEDTNSRFEDVEEGFEEINSNIGGLHILVQQTSDGLSAEVSRAIGAEANLSSQITMSANEIKLAVSETYQTKTDASSQYASLSSEIQLTSETITSTVKATYETKDEANSKKLNLESQIRQTATDIALRVSGEYQSISNAEKESKRLESRIDINANGIKQTVQKGDIISSINQSAESVSINASKINLNGAVTANDYFKVKLDGSVEAKYAVFDDSYFTRGIYIKLNKSDANSYPVITLPSAGTLTFANQNTHTDFWGSVGFSGGLSSYGFLIASTGNPFCYKKIYMQGGLESSGTGEVYFKDLDTSSGSANVNIGNAGKLKMLSGSLRKWKHDIREIEDQSIDPRNMYNVKPFQFIYNDDYLSETDCRYGKAVPGFVVDGEGGFLENYPIAVDFDENGNPENWNPRYVIPPMLQLIQEQKKKLDNQDVLIAKIISKIGGI